MKNINKFLSKLGPFKWTLHNLIAHPLKETFIRIGGKLPVNEDYRAPEENAEILKALLNDKEHSKYVTEELYQWLEDWDGLDEFVELMLDELNPDLGRYKIPNMRPE